MKEKHHPAVMMMNITRVIASKNCNYVNDEITNKLY